MLDWSLLRFPTYGSGKVGAAIKKRRSWYTLSLPTTKDNKNDMDPTVKPLYGHQEDAASAFA